MTDTNGTEQRAILAPMVRIGTLPMRILALRFGADLVYTEELIDWKLLRSKRVVNDVLGTVDYVDITDGTIVFRTCLEEKKKVVLQIGTCDPERAVKVAKLVEEDVAGIDVNMGCPKEFSLKGGMGAALMQDIDKAESILRALVTSTSLPITCKVRVFEDDSATIRLCQRLAGTGISGIAIHGRTVSERPLHRNRNSTIRAVAQALNIPVIANGGSKEMDCYEDILKFAEEVGCKSVMIARAAEWNASIFRRSGKLPLEEVMRAYLKLAVHFDNAPANTKYCIQNMLRELQDTERGRKFLEAQTLQQICEVFGLGDYCLAREEELRERGMRGRRGVRPAGLVEKVPEDGVTELECAFLRALYSKDVELPKSRLLAWARSQGLRPPSYSTTRIDKLFQSTVTVAGNKYRSSFWEKNKRWAEQGAAIVCLYSHGLLDDQALRNKGIMR